MARREYENMGGVEGLIFHAPLNVQGDMTDHVGGLVPTVMSKTLIAWDSTYGGYRIKPSSYASSSGGNHFTSGIVYNIDWSPIDQSREYTILYEIIQYSVVRYSTSVWPGLCELALADSDTSYYRATRDNYPMNIAGTLNTPIYIASWNRRRNGINTVGRYLNGENYAEGQNTYSQEIMNTLRLFVGNQRDGRSSYYNDAVFKDIMIFDRILTQDEIKKIQGL